MRFILLVSLLFPGAAFAESIKAVAYKHASCLLVHGEDVVKVAEQPLMPLMIEERLGRFAQIQFGDQNLKIQYQLLIEDDLEMVGNVLILQNLLVGKYESSAEFSAGNASWVKVVNGDYSVRCELLK